MSSCSLFPGVKTKRPLEEAAGSMLDFDFLGVAAAMKAVHAEKEAAKIAMEEDDIWDKFDFEQTVERKTREGFSCPDCETSEFVVIEAEEVLCKGCGSHIEWLIDMSAEYRHYGADDRSPDPARVGNPIDPLLVESSLGTRMLARPGESREMQKIRKMHQWNIMPYRERTLWGVFDQLEERARNAGIPTAIVNESKHLYAQVSPLGISRGEGKESLQAACLYESLKRHDTPWRPAEIAEIFKIDVKLITRGVKKFSGLLEAHQHNKAKGAGVSVVAEAATVATVATAATAATNVTNATNATEAAEAAGAGAAAGAEAGAAAGAGAAKPASKTETPSTHFRQYLESAIYKLETPRTYHHQILQMATRIGEAIDKYGICPETTAFSLAAASLALTCERMGFLVENAQERVKSVARVCSISPATLQKCLKRIDERWRAILFKE